MLDTCNDKQSKLMIKGLILIPYIFENIERKLTDCRECYLLFAVADEWWSEAAGEEDFLCNPH